MLSPTAKGSDNDAWALLSLRSASGSPSRNTTEQSSSVVADGSNGVALARLQGRDFEFTMRKSRVTVGRSSSKGEVDVEIGYSSFVSRVHLEIVCVDTVAQRFLLYCKGKNGIFVDGTFCRKGSVPAELPKKCTLRFPSTTMKIVFQVLVHVVESDVGSRSAVDHPSAPVCEAQLLQPLQINIPLQADAVPVSFSPCPSPSGTISVANSCPTSPNSGGSRLQIAFDAPVPPKRSAVNTGGVRKHAAPKPIMEGGQNSEDLHMVGNGSHSKPPYSYAQLIVQAIASSPDRQLTLSGIYNYISKHFPYYHPLDKGWQNSIRHNLSLNRCFVKVARAQEEPGKGSFWRIDPSSEAKLIEQAFRRRRQRITSSLKMPTNEFSARLDPISPSDADDGVVGDDDDDDTESSSENKQFCQVVTPSLTPQFLQLPGDIRFVEPAAVSGSSPKGGAVSQPLSLSSSSAASSGINIQAVHPAVMGGTHVNASGPGFLVSPKPLQIPLGGSKSTPFYVVKNNLGQQTGQVVNSDSVVMPKSEPVTHFAQVPISQAGITSSVFNNQAALIQRLLQHGTAMVVGQVPSSPSAQLCGLRPPGGVPHFQWIVRQPSIKQESGVVTPLSSASVVVSAAAVDVKSEGGPVQPQVASHNGDLQKMAVKPNIMQASTGNLGLSGIASSLPDSSVSALSQVLTTVSNENSGITASTGHKRPLSSDSSVSDVKHAKVECDSA